MQRLLPGERGASAVCPRSARFFVDNLLPAWGGGRSTPAARSAVDARASGARWRRWLGQALAVAGTCWALAAGLQAAEVKLAWDPSPDPDVTNYRVYWGYQSRTYTTWFDVGNVTNATVGALAEGTRYFFAVTATTDDGWESDYSNEVEYTTPLSPPPAPVVELRPGANPWEVQLVWSASADSRVTNYRVYWGTRSRTYPAAFDVGSVTRATVSDLAAGTTYYFAVSAMTSDGQQSPLSNEVSYTTPLPPLAVPVLELRPGSVATEVVLVWTAVSDPAVNNYRVYWGTQGHTYTASLDVGDVVTATVRSLTAGTTYFFAVTATASDGRESAFSNEAIYTVPLPPPEPPVLEVKAGSSATGVNLTWTPTPNADVVQYRVYWGEQSGVYAESVDMGNVTTFTLDSLVPGTTYFFAVTALTADGRESDYSNEVEYTVPAPPPLQVAQTPPVLVEVISRLSHRSAGTFELPLNLHSPFSVEGRITSTLELVFRFDKPVNAVTASVVRGIGTIAGPPAVNGTEVTVLLTGVASRQWLAVRLADICSQDGAVLSEAGVTLGVLGGDVNGDGAITNGDVELVRAVSGQLVNANNYRADVNLSGTLSNADVQTVRMRVGQRVPAY